MFLVIFLAGKINYLLMPIQNLLKLISRVMRNWGFDVYVGGIIMK